MSNPEHQSGVYIYKRLLRYALEHKKVFLIAIIGMLVTTAADTGFVAMLKPIMDKGLIERDSNFTRWLPWVICVVFLARGIGVFTYTLGMTWVSRSVIYTLRKQLFETALNLPAHFYDKNSSTSVVSKLVYDVEQVASSSTVVIRTLVKDSILLIALFIWMLYLNYKLTLIFIICLPLIFIIVRTASKKFRKTSHQIQDTISEIANKAQETFQGQIVVKVFNGQTQEIQKFDNVNQRNKKRALKKALISSINISLILFVIGVALAVILKLIMSSSPESVSAGDFVSYLGAILVMLSPVKRLAGINETLQQGIAGAGSVFSLIDEEPETETGTVDSIQCNGEIELKNVSFKYDNETENILSDINIRIKSGEQVALVGASGSGKSTIASLLLKLYSPTHGEIVIDGVSLADVRLKTLRSYFSLVTQDAILFDDSIYNNIIYGENSRADEKRLNEICDAAHLTEFTDRLPEGLHTKVGERGTRLSGGQRQRIAIARAFYKNAPILILDEATSALDTHSERLVQQATQALKQGRTTIVIAHRLSTIENADCIYVMDQGRIVESGTSEQLISKNGYYARLWQAQQLNNSTTVDKLNYNA